MTFHSRFNLITIYKRMLSYGTDFVNKIHSIRGCTLGKEDVIIGEG